MVPFTLLQGRKKPPAGGEHDTPILDLAAFEGFIAEDDGPFCPYLASNEPHGPHTIGDPADFPADSIELAPYLPDTPATRKGMSAYLAEVAEADRQVGEMLRILDASGKASNTLVFFFSEQGNGIPFSKWTLYNPGVRIATIARWPGKIEPGSESAALMQYVDILPTIIEAAGGDPSSCETGCPDANGDTGFDGQSTSTCSWARPTTSAISSSPRTR